MPIIWKSIREFEDRYEVSSSGKVRNIWTRRILKPRPDNDGYMHVTLHRPGRIKYATVHGLVARYFIGKCPKGFHVDHKDAKRDNNRCRNLRYLPPIKNVHHSMSLGLHPHGESHGMAKLTERKVQRIREKYLSIESKLKENEIVLKSISDKRSRIKGIRSEIRKLSLHLHIRRPNIAKIIARQFRVRCSTILSIVQRKTWKHLP